MSYTGIESLSDETTPHLGGNALQGDPYTFCPTVWEYVIQRFAVSSVLDLGSGIGHASDFFFKKGLKVLAVEGLEENVRQAVYPTLRHDLTFGAVHTSVDLVHCHEVVEHIEERYLQNLLDSLACGRVVLMTHATPGQGGHHHVNEQPKEYWIGHLEKMGYNFLEEDTTRIRRFALRDNAAYMANSGLLFARSSTF